MHVLQFLKRRNNLQKTNIIGDYLEDINEIPKSHMFLPRDIWGKYADKLEDIKYEENSSKVVKCLNEMVTNALMHIKDCLKSISILRDPAIFRLWQLEHLHYAITMYKYLEAL